MKTKIVLIIFFVFLFSCRQNVKEEHEVPKEEPSKPIPSRITVELGDVSFDMIKIPETKDVVLGDDLHRDSKKRTCSISSFMLGETEVTQALYYEVIKENPSYFNNKPDEDKKKAITEGESQELRPIENITWYDAIVFCNELTKLKFGEYSCVYYSNKAMTETYKAGDATKHSQKPVFVNWNKKGFRLPTEAEWEIAALAGTQNTWAGCSEEGLLPEYAWAGSHAKRTSHQVKMLKSNEWNLYDMTGNVNEWCFDYYVNDETPEGGENPKGSDYGLARAIRGGSCEGMVDDQTIPFRWGWSPINQGHATVGIRLARSL